MSRALSGGSPAASFTATMLGTSPTSRSSTSVLILRPVRIGMSYSTTGRSVAAASVRKCASMPACEGRL